MASKLLVVFGATGTQGGSVIESVLGDPRAAKEFKLRGITRDPSKANAKALSAKGVEMVSGDLNSKNSLESTMRGAYAVYSMTNYWEKMDKELELQQGKNIADAAKAQGVQHLIWSSLLNITELTKGKWAGVDHFDSKADVEKYIRSIGIRASFFMPGFYMSNIPGAMLIPNPHSEQREFILAPPWPRSTQVPLFDAAADTGKFVKAMLLNREKVLGKRIYAATDYYGTDDILKAVEEAFPKKGKGAHYVQVSEEDFRKGLAGAGMPERAQEEMWENMMFMDEFGYYGKASLDESHAILDEKPTTFKEFIVKVPMWKDLD